jgi:hypothetical protein
MQVHSRCSSLSSPPPPLPTGREAALFEPDQFNPTLRSVLSADALAAGDRFSFAGPLPPRFGIIIRSQGLTGEDFEPEFRTGLLEASSLPASALIRAEIVVGPEVGFSSVDVARWASAIPLPIQTNVASPAGGVSARVELLTIEATLATGIITLRAGGQIDWTPGAGLSALGGARGRTAFTATLRLAFMLPPTPMIVEPCHVGLHGDPDVEISGLAGALAALALPFVRDLLEGMLTKQVDQALVREVRAIVAAAFALSELPPGVTVSIRRLKVEGDTVSFQPAIGALGTTLSTFHPPPV